MPNMTRTSLWYSMSRQRTGLLIRSLAFLFILGVIIFFCLLGYLNFELPHPDDNKLQLDVSSANFVSRKVLCADVDELSSKASELEKQLKEMDRIKAAGLHELTRMEEKIFKMNDEMRQLARNRDLVRENWRSLQKDVSKAKLDLKQLKYSEMARKREKIVPVGLPIHFEGDKALSTKFDKSDTKGCSLEECFDYSKCPLTSQFSFYVYNPVYFKRMPSSTGISQYLFEKFLQLAYLSPTFKTACLTIAIIDVTRLIRKPNNLYLIEEIIQSLKYWGKNGQNHILMFVHEDERPLDCSIFEKLDTGMAIVVFNSFCQAVFRKDFDLILPSIPNKQLDKQHLKWKILQPILPLKRKYLFNLIVDIESNNSFTHKISKKEFIALRDSEKAFVQLHCGNKKFVKNSNDPTLDCNNMEDVGAVFINSTFTVLFMDVGEEYSHLFYKYFFEALKGGSIPVLVGTGLPMPFSGLILWEELTIMISLSRLPELQFILQTIPDEDLFELKKQGRFIWETYFSSTTTIIETALAVIRSRIKLPPVAFKDISAPPVNEALNKERAVHETQVGVMLPSKTFAHNWTYLSINLHSSWNRPPGGIKMTPSNPLQTPLPSSIPFLPPNEYAPIGDGIGGDGGPFSKALGGDHTVEHFTIVMLTYDRELILLESLQRLSGLRYLNRVIVVWNNPAMPSPELKWPDIGVELHVVRPGSNSLNNRFLPYDLIDTDAILSMDDDIYLRHDEIELAFRVWRGNRDRIVGFPGRFHSWENDRWFYNANYSCELTMVLTGGAFFHKFYSYIYTYLISPSIKNIVDEYMNCEDIAMNFLVAHITGKAPIKVTSRWTFRCPGCPNSLSADHSHFTERGECIHLFEKIFGYMPLRRTQFRADSVLFKTRLPPRSSKCYQFV